MGAHSGNGRNGNQEALREELALCQQERNEADAESEAGQQVVTGLMEHRQVGHDAHPDFQTTEDFSGED